MLRALVDPGIEIRMLEDRNSEALFQLVERNRDRLREWLPWVDRTQHEGPLREFIAIGLQQYAAGEGFHAGIWVDGEIRGAIGIHRINWSDRNTALGYWLDESAEGRGVMTRCTRAMLDYLFYELHLQRVEIRCGAANQKSCAIPQRLGFTREGIARQGQCVN